MKRMRTGSLRLLLVHVTKAVTIATTLAVSGWLGIIHAVWDWRKRFKILKHSVEILVRYVPETFPWHDGNDLPGTQVAGPHHLYEHVISVIRDP